MDVNDRNLLFSKGEIERDDLWPKITEYRDQPCTVRFSFGLDKLPTEAGIILIRGPRLLLALMRTLFVQAGSRTGYLKLARESGLANNTIAAEYVEQLSDLLAVVLHINGIPTNVYRCSADRRSFISSTCPSRSHSARTERRTSANSTP